MPRDIALLLIEARRHLGVSQGTLGEMLGSSERTGQRWERGGSTPMPKQLHELARRVHPNEPSLAAEIAAASARLAGLSVEAVDKALHPAKSDGAPSTPNKKRS